MLPLAFNNQFTACLPGDAETGPRRRLVKDALFSRVQPTPVRAPKLLHASRALAQTLGLSEADCQSEDFLQIFAGNQVMPGMDPHAGCYGGHQFGNWAGQLGDGRAINLGEVELSQGHLMLQLKGAGETPYSRTADGLAVLRSSLREYVCSEAMFHLGIPTTRALSLIVTGEAVVRDMLYDGNAAPEPGAVVCRASSSFVRFGHFQMLAARGEEHLLVQFTDFIIRTEFPALTSIADQRERTLAWFSEVCDHTAKLMVHWMRVGFVHGVMNTDNMSILGETIDYGPYGWLENFDPAWTPNTTDAGQRRYRYGQQPAVAQWNLMQLANAILPLVQDPKPLEDALSHFVTVYEQQWQQMMASKLGLLVPRPELVERLLKLMAETETDMTILYRKLADIDQPHELAALGPALYQPEALEGEFAEGVSKWLRDYLSEAEHQGQGASQRKQLMNRTNPLYVPRNYLAQLAIDDAEQGDCSRLQRWMQLLQSPYEEQEDAEEFAAKRPEWARHRAGCSMLSCSS